MYKRYAALFLLFYLVLGTGWLCVQGIYIDKKAVSEAFLLVESGGDEVLQATSYLGVSSEQISRERVLDMNVLVRKNRVEISDEEYEDLLRIVEAEAGGEDILGKMLVANVILNRVEDDRFPDTVTQVIFQAENGVTQFSPISDGRFYTVKVSEETREAVDAALRGEDNSQGALYFAARKAADKDKMRWFDNHLNRLFAYGGHEFFS
ncbi:MAG: cell wall hydrolase [Lachnospiraceae bacterium]|nr:cell wall hydrolase [Lachnospiraceae bacterium]